MYYKTKRTQSTMHATRDKKVIHRYKPITRKQITKLLWKIPKRNKLGNHLKGDIPNS